MDIRYIFKGRYEYTFLKASVVNTSLYKINEVANYDYVILSPNVAKMLTVTKLIGGAAKVTNATPSRTVEDSIRKILWVDQGEKRCRKDICGKPDYIREGTPGEIKSFNSIANPYIVEEEVRQAVVYSWLYNTKYAYITVGIYEPINEVKALIKEIAEARLQVDYFNEEMLEKELNKTTICARLVR